MRTPETDRRVLELREAGLTRRQIADRLGVSFSAVRGWLERMKSTKPRGDYWKPESDEYLRQASAAGKTRPEMAAHLGVSIGSVAGRCHRLGLSVAMVSRVWTDAKNTQLLDLVNSGLTHRAAGAILGVSRDAALQQSKMLRGIKVRDVKPREPREPRPVKAPPKPRPVLATVGKLSPYGCMWPFGDPRKPGFHFCGASAQLGCSYCPSHYEDAYQTTRRAA